MTIEKHKRALAYGEIPPSFERPPLTTSTRLPEEYRTDEEQFDAFFETELRKMFIRPGLVR